ncbi:MAG: prolyl oligopeptidase family serine peptidase [Pseudothermotoga sp.]
MREEREISLVTNVSVLGETVCAVVIEYPTEVDGSRLTPEYFSVRTKVLNRYVQRTITKVFANNSDETTFNMFRNKGKFVILELDPHDQFSKTFQFDANAFLNRPVAIDYLIAQVVPIEDASGHELMPFVCKQTHVKRQIIDEFSSFVFKGSEAFEIPYRLFIPKDAEQNAKYPLVVFLHGAGARGTDNHIQLAENQGATVWAHPKHQAVHPCFVLAPQCPPNDSWSTLFTDPQNPFNPGKPLLTVIKIIEKLLNEYNIDENRVYITGLSMGGYGTWAATMNFPELFAAAIPICGGGDVNKVSQIKHIPIWAFHAEDDGIVPVDHSRYLVKALSRIGGNVRYTEFEKGYLTSRGFDPHWSWIAAYENSQVIEWLFDQKRRQN